MESESNFTGILGMKKETSGIAPSYTGPLCASLLVLWVHFVSSIVKSMIVEKGKGAGPEGVQPGEAMSGRIQVMRKNSVLLH